MKNTLWPKFALDPNRLRRGFSLVELMISMVIGLVILAGVISIFLSSKQAFRTQEGMGQVQESGRFVSYLVSPYIRHAGYLPEPRVQLDPQDHFRGNWKPVFGSENSFFPDGRFTNVASVKAGTDALMVSYAGGQPSVGTCRGGEVSDSQIVTNVFYVSAPDTTGLGALNCGTTLIEPPDPSKTGSNLRTAETGSINIVNAQPLIQGVQDMQILYGVDTDPSDDDSLLPGQSGLFANRYVTANFVPDWERVVSVRITLTIDGAERTEGATDIGDGTADVQDDFVQDGRIRRTFTTTIHIRNRLRA